MNKNYVKYDFQQIVSYIIYYSRMWNFENNILQYSHKIQKLNIL